MAITPGNVFSVMSADMVDAVGSSYRGPERRRARRAPIDSHRRAVKPMRLLHPEDIPTVATIRAAMDAPLRAACRAALAHANGGVQQIMTALSEVAALDELAPEQDVPFLVETGQLANGGTHDSFFRIRRLAHTSPLAYLSGLFRALDLLDKEVATLPTSLPDSALDEIANGLHLAIAAAIGEDTSEHPKQWARCMVVPDAHAAITRWLRGHHIFAALTQALVFAMRVIEDGYAAQDEGAQSDAARLCVRLFNASARAFELTGDFPASKYRELIRDAMEPPFQPRGFSGLLSKDHHELVGRMRLAKPALTHLGRIAPQLHAELHAALNRVYDSHRHVCAHFVGQDRASLLMSKEIGRSAVEQLDRFRTMRLRSIGCPVRS